MNLQNRLLYGFFRALSRMACQLGPDRTQAVGEFAANRLLDIYRVSPYRDFVAGNLMTAMPDLDRKTADDLVARHLRQLVRSIGEVLALPSLDRDALISRVAWEGSEHLQAARNCGHGAIVLSAHFGNWELMAARIAAEVPFSVLVQTPSQGAFDRMFIEHRTLHGVATHANQGPASLRPILRALQRNEAVGLLIDQHGEAQDAFATMFGQRISVPAGAFFLAEKTGAALLPSFIVREAGHAHRIVMEAPLPPGSPDELAQRFHDRLEHFARRHPDHWLWAHDRWARAGELRSARPLEASRS